MAAFKILLAASAAAVALAPNLAQAQTAPGTPPPAASSRSGVVVYPPEFFASNKPATALDMIGRLPGFSLDTGDNVRGFAGAGGNVLIDGERPATKSDPLDEILRRTAASAVERIELIYAGTPGVDMQGRSVLANVVLKKKARVERVLNLSTYAYPDGYLGPTFEYQVSKSEGINLLEGSVKVLTDRTDFTAQGERTRSSGPNPLEEVDLELWDHVWSGSAKGSLQRGAFGGKYRINALVENSRFSRQEEQTYRRPTPGEGATNESNNDWNGELGGQFDRKFGEALSLELIGLQRLEQSTYGSVASGRAGSSSFGENDLSGESIARGVLRWQRAPNLTFEGSGELAFNFLDSQTAYRDPGGREDADVRVEELRGEVAGKASWQVSSRLSLEGGARIEVSRISQESHTVSTFGGPSSVDGAQQKDLIYVKPRFVAVWSPDPANQLRLRIEREVGQLNFGDFVASTSLETGTVDARNPDLEPNRQWTFEAAYERRFWSEGSVVLLLRHAALEDAVDIVPVGAFSAPGNIGSGRSDQLRLDLTLPLSKLGVPGGRLKGFVSWVDSEVTDPTTRTKRRLTNQNERVCEIHYTQDLRGGRWSYGAGAYCPTRYWQFRVNEVRHYDVEYQLETFIQYKPRQDLSIRLDWQNMTARTLSRTREVYSGPRSSAPLAYVEQRDVPFDSWLWLRIRKSF